MQNSTVYNPNTYFKSIQIFCPQHKEKQLIKYVCADNDCQNKLLCQQCLESEINHNIIQIGDFYDSLRQYLMLKNDSEEIFDLKYQYSIEGKNQDLQLIRFMSTVSSQQLKLLSQFQTIIANKIKEFIDESTKLAQNLEEFCLKQFCDNLESILGSQGLRKKIYKDQIIRVILNNSHKSDYNELQNTLTSLHQGQYEANFCQLEFKQLIQTQLNRQIDDFLKGNLQSLRNFTIELNNIKLQSNDESTEQEKSKTINFRIQNVNRQDEFLQKEFQSSTLSNFSQFKPAVPMVSPQSSRSDVLNPFDLFQSSLKINLDNLPNNQKFINNSQINDLDAHGFRSSFIKTEIDQGNYFKNLAPTQLSFSEMKQIKDSLNYIVNPQKHVSYKQNYFVKPKNSVSLNNVKVFQVSESLEKQMKIFTRDVKQKFIEIQDSVSTRHERDYTLIEKNKSFIEKPSSVIKEIQQEGFVKEMAVSHAFKQDIIDFIQITEEMYILGTQSGNISVFILKKVIQNEKEKLQSKIIYYVHAHQKCTLLAQSSIPSMFFSCGLSNQNENSIKLWLIQTQTSLSELLELQSLHSYPIQELVSIYDTFKNQSNLLYVVTYADREDLKFSQISYHNKSLFQKSKSQNNLMTDLKIQLTDSTDSLQIIQKISMVIKKIYFVKEKLVIITQKEILLYQMNFEGEIEIHQTQSINLFIIPPGSQSNSKKILNDDYLNMFDVRNQEIILGSKFGKIYVFDVDQFVVKNHFDFFSKLCFRCELKPTNYLKSSFLLNRVLLKDERIAYIFSRFDDCEEQYTIDIHSEEIKSEDRQIQLPILQYYNILEGQYELFIEKNRTINVWKIR